MEQAQKANSKKILLRNIIIVFSILVLLTAIILGCEWINIAKKNQKILSYMEGRNFFIDRSTSVWGPNKYVISVQDGEILIEHWKQSPQDKEGTIIQSEGRLQTQLFATDTAIQVKGESYWSTVELVVICDDGTVTTLTYHDTDPVWEEKTKDELSQMRASFLCANHEFSQWKVIKAPGCTTNGQQQHICEKCGYSESESIESLGHNYKNKICTICGEKKQPEISNIEANTWYTYQDVLHFQNIKLQNAFSVSQGKGMMVSYYFVCQHCHAVDETLQQNIPEFNYKINKMFTCKECENFTTVRIELG